MRLFLSSQDFGNYAEVARRLAGDNPKAAFIKNAQDDKPATERNFTTPQKKLMFEAAGFEFEEIDLRDYFGQADKLAAKLPAFGSVWCAGGNSFILRRAMRASGFDRLIVNMLREDKILYGGWSAGALITAPSLHGMEYGDRPQPDVVPEAYPIKETLWDGLNVVDFTIIPHCKSDWFGEESDRCIKYFAERQLPYRPLTDGQVITITGDKEEFLQ